jgi:hypothetical protein
MARRRQEIDCSNNDRGGHPLGDRKATDKIGINEGRNEIEL